MVPNERVKQIRSIDSELGYHTRVRMIGNDELQYVSCTTIGMTNVWMKIL